MDNRNIQKVEQGKYVTYAYKLYNDANSELLFEASEDAPDAMIYGFTPEIVPGLAAALKGLTPGSRFTVTLPPAVAFGDRIEENVISLDKEIFMKDGNMAEEVRVGAEVPMMTQEGFRVLGRVIEIGDKVKMDFNHPFAGLTVRYDGLVIEVRDATPEELNPSGCGCCGHGGCDDGCCDSEHNHCHGCK